MGHYCRFCGRIRANEKFTGKGHKTHVCKDCQKLPKASREKTEVTEELFGYLAQSRISKKNKKRLQELVEHSDPHINQLAGLLLEVAKIAEGKRRRWRRVRETDPDLYFKCKKAGLTPEPL